MEFNFCPKCGFKFDDEYNFCPKCGYKLSGEQKSEPEPLFDFSDDTAKYDDGAFDGMLRKQQDAEEKIKVAEEKARLAEEKVKAAEEKARLAEERAKKAESATKEPAKKAETKSAAKKPAAESAAKKPAGTKNELVLTAAEQKEFDAAIKKFDDSDPSKHNFEMSYFDKRKEAAEILQKYAKKGDAEAQYRVGRAGINSSTQSAWYEKAAEQGHAEAQLELGRDYLYGCGGVKKDLQKALYWLNKASDNRNAWFPIGLVYESRGDYDNAIKWYQRDIDDGLKSYNVDLSMECLGRVYEAQKDYEKAAQCYEKLVQKSKNDKFRIKEYKDALKRVKALMGK